MNGRGQGRRRVGSGVEVGIGVDSDPDADADSDPDAWEVPNQNVGVLFGKNAVSGLYPLEPQGLTFGNFFFCRTARFNTESRRTTVSCPQGTQRRARGGSRAARKTNPEAVSRDRTTTYAHHFLFQSKKLSSSREDE